MIHDSFVVKKKDLSSAGLLLPQASIFCSRNMSTEICPHSFSTDISPPRLFVFPSPLPPLPSEATLPTRADVCPLGSVLDRSHAVHREECTLCFDDQVSVANSFMLLRILK
jgi:hypothetical protein